MYRNLFLIFVAAAFLMACGSQGNTSQDDQAEAQQEQVAVNEPIVVALADFDAKAETLVGQEVILEGTVVHVCKHGGKKMFITAEDPEVRIKITPGEETESFDVELEGSYVKIHGVVEAMEAEVVDEGENTEAGEHVEDADHENYYHKPQYSVSCFEYTVKENIPEGE